MFKSAVPLRFVASLSKVEKITKKNNIFDPVKVQIENL
jgi:hypothetical protein